MMHLARALGSSTLAAVLALPAVASEPIHIRGGAFLQGTEARHIPALVERYDINWPAAFENESPQRRVTVSSFRLGSKEVTNSRFAAFLEEHPEWRKERLAAELHNGRYLELWSEGGPPAAMAG